MAHLPNIVLCVSFLFTGCINSILTQLILYHAPIDSKSMLLVFCAYVGYALRYLLPTGKQEEVAQSKSKRDEERGEQRAKNNREKKEQISTRRLQLYIFLMTLAEVGASQIAILGFSLVGSGLYQVLYSSIILFTALVSVLVLRSGLSFLQWVSLALITAGLVLSAGQIDTGEVPVQGIVYLFIATFLLSCTSTLAASLMQKYNFPSAKYSTLNGIYGSCIIGTYILFVTTAHWEEWVAAPITSANAELGSFLVLLGVLVIGQLIRGIAYYNCLEVLGSVSTGVLYALQAVCMFGLSAVLFCDATHPNQCLSTPKAIGTAVVSCGVALYSLGKKQGKSKV